MAENIVIRTSLGDIYAEIYTREAPITSCHFLRHVDEGFYNEATFYRAMRPDNDGRLPKICAIQGGIDPTASGEPLPSVSHETTATTGLSHVDGALSMVRWEPGSASSEFFICIGDLPELDFGGARNPDKQGFAVFGRVIEGMGIVRQINAKSTLATTNIEFMKNQALTNPVPICIERISAGDLESTRQASEVKTVPPHERSSG